MIVKAAISDADKLTQVALNSKRFWGYSSELVESWRTDLTVTPKMLTAYSVYKYIDASEIVGFYVLHRANIRTSFLEFLFVAPKYIKKGIGKQLLHHAIQYAKEGSCAIVNVLSDPNAVGFYTKQGFQIIAQRESSIPGRFLPEMEYQIIENS